MAAGSLAGARGSKWADERTLLLVFALMVSAAALLILAPGPRDDAVVDAARVAWGPARAAAGTSGGGGHPGRPGGVSALRVRDRPAPLHRLPRVHGGLQGGEPGAARRVPHLGQVRRARDVPAHAALLLRAALQPLRSRAVRAELPAP